MKKIGFTMLVVLLLVFASSVNAEPIKLKYANFEPPKSFGMRAIWNPWIETLNKAGKGIFVIEPYVGGTLNRNPLKQLKILKDGVADIAFILPNYTPGVFSDDAVVELPFIGDKAIDTSLAAYGMYQEGLFRNYDLIVPLMVSAGQQYAIHSTFPVRVPSDMKGKKIRATGKMQHLIAKALGAAPIGMPVTKIAESMSRGLIQATTNEWNAVRTFKIGGIAKYHCMLPLGTVTFLQAMNKAKFDSLPQKAKDIFINHRDYSVRLWANAMDNSLGTHQQKMIDDPEHKVYFPTPEETKEWKKVLQTAVDAWLSQDPNRKKLMEIYKKKVAAAKIK